MSDVFVARLEFMRDVRGIEWRFCLSIKPGEQGNLENGIF